MSNLKQLYQGSPVIIQPPISSSFITLATTGGSIAASTALSYRVTARIGSTETLAATAVTTTTGSGTSTNTATISWSPVPGATDYRIYGRTSGSELLIGTSSTNTFTDTGSVTPSGALPVSSGFAESTTTPGLYLPTSGKTGLIIAITCTNPTTYPGQVFVSVVPNGGTASQANRVVAGTTVLPESQSAPLYLPRKHVVPSGGFVAGYVTVAGMTLTLDGVET